MSVMTRDRILFMRTRMLSPTERHLPITTWEIWKKSHLHEMILL